MLVSNPARELHAIYVDWQSKIHPPRASVGDVLRPTTAQGQPQYLTAMKLLIRMGDLLTEFESNGMAVDVFRKWYPKWWGPVLAHPGGWRTDNAASAFPQEVLDQIEVYATFLDGKVYEFPDAKKPTLRSVLDEVRDLLEKDDSLDQALRQYIHRLLTLIQNALDDEAVGAATDMATRVRELWVALRAAEGASVEKKSRWNKVWWKIWPSAAAGAVVEGGSVLVQALTGME